MILVFMALSTGYLVLEAVANDRTYATWKTLVDERLKSLGTGGLSLVSDRATALIHLAEHGLACLSMPDVFHVTHESIKSYALALGRPLRYAPQERTTATEAVTRLQGRPHAAQDASEAQALVGGAAGRGDALGRSAPHLLPPLGHPLAHAASLPHSRCGSPDLCPG
jgi:hypothetical protein